MEVCSTDERLQQETFCHRQWTDEYVHVCRTSRDVEEAERSRRQCLLVDVVRHMLAPDHVDTILYMPKQ